ncbi:MAG TPA: type II toxin-antitoxin system prevent-host-death family antitoxin [Gemmatimonadaceae bacterium]|nr:type II toxin-antitoxin system prevent-host-death family antitoxin [Gemmatimonadaceae bacterium]
MKKKSDRTVGVAELKARLSAYLRLARRGEAITVRDRDTPVAMLVPYETEDVVLPVRRPVRSLQDVELPPPLGRRIDSLAELLESRQTSR